MMPTDMCVWVRRDRVDHGEGCQSGWGSLNWDGEIFEETWGAGNVPAEETLRTPRLGTLRQNTEESNS